MRFIKNQYCYYSYKQMISLIFFLYNLELQLMHIEYYP